MGGDEVMNAKFR